jgi:hypothetical protein
LSVLRRVAYCGGTNSMLRLQLERRGDRMNHCRKLKRRHRSHFGSVGKKCDTVRRHGNAGWRRGDTEEEGIEETILVGLTRILLGQKIKKIHVTNSTDSNG